MNYKIVSHIQNQKTISVDNIRDIIKYFNEKDLKAFYKACYLNRKLSGVVTEAYEQVFYDEYRDDPTKRGEEHLVKARKEDEMEARLLKSGVLTKGACIARHARAGYTKKVVAALTRESRTVWNGFQTLLPESSALSGALENRDRQMIPILLDYMTPEQIFRQPFVVYGTELHNAVRVGDILSLRQVLAKARNAEDINFSAEGTGTALAYARRLGKPDVEAEIVAALARFEPQPPARL